MELLEKKKDKSLITWLIINLLLVVLIIIVGGLTRLTDSGLSITEWELFTGILPPLNQTSWNFYFNLYKEIPQYKFLNSSMSLEQFKIIFYWEYIHRILARVIGLSILLPLLYFYFIKKIDPKILKPYFFIFILVALQGIIGWYMVKSGLTNNISVSHYRLSLHLSMAIIITSFIFWEILNIKNNSHKSFFSITKINFIYLIPFILIFLQIILGALVSGLDAGKIYQTWPLMGNHYVPDDFVSNKIISFFDFNNHSLVQFYHRNFAYLITLYIFVLFFYIIRSKKKNLYKPIFLLVSFLILQIILGIFSLLSDLNIWIASAHQISSVILILTALNLYYSRIN